MKLRERESLSPVALRKVLAVPDAVADQSFGEDHFSGILGEASPPQGTRITGPG